VKLQRVISAVYFEPWAITPDGWRTVHQIVKPRALGEIDALSLPQAKDDEHDFFGNPLPKMEITHDGVAIIPIQGVLIHHASLMDKQCGACSYQDVRANVETALDEAVKKIAFHCDSPGGMCMGCSETAAIIDRAADFVRCEAVTDGLMCSACYDMIAGCQAIYCTPSAVVGSIGAMSAWLDQSVRYELMGLKVELFASGPLKGTGTPGTELTDVQRDYLQSNVDKYAAMFKSHVTANRLVEDATMQGQTFIGSDAVDAGLVDELVDDCEECFEP
jgi:ClpP class serine protease